jgi:hypothetical protein
VLKSKTPVGVGKEGDGQGKAEAGELGAESVELRVRRGPAEHTEGTENGRAEIEGESGKFVIYRMTNGSAGGGRVGDPALLGEVVEGVAGEEIGEHRAG